MDPRCAPTRCTLADTARVRSSSIALHPPRLWSEIRQTSFRPESRDARSRPRPRPRAAFRCSATGREFTRTFPSPIGVELVELPTSFRLSSFQRNFDNRKPCLSSTFDYSTVSIILACAFDSGSKFYRRREMGDFYVLSQLSFSLVFHVRVSDYRISFDKVWYWRDSTRGSLLFLLY